MISVDPAGVGSERHRAAGAPCLRSCATRRLNTLPTRGAGRPSSSSARAAGRLLSEARAPADLRQISGDGQVTMPEERQIAAGFAP